MSISSIDAGASPAYQSGLSSLFKQRKQDFKAIEDAVQSGDLASAKQAVAVFQQDQQNIQNARSAIGGQSQSSQQNSPFKNDVSAVIGAIQSGDLTGAQTALKTLEQDQQSRFGNGPAHGPGTFKNDLQSLFQAVQSGDLTSAQQSLSAVQTDMKASGAGHHHHHHHGGNNGDATGNSQVSSSSGNPTSSLTSSSSSNGASADSTTSIQTLLNNLVNSAAQAAYSSVTSMQTTPSLLSTQA